MKYVTDASIYRKTHIVNYVNLLKFSLAQMSFWWSLHDLSVAD